MNHLLNNMEYKTKKVARFNLLEAYVIPSSDSSPENISVYVNNNKVNLVGIEVRCTRLINFNYET